MKKTTEYLKINLSKEEFILKLTYHIKNEIPLSFSRFGDGEINFINNTLNAKIKTQLKETWGYDDIEVAKKDVLDIINVSLCETDIIGIMCSNNDISKKISYKEHSWSIAKDYINTIRTKDLLVADHMIVRDKEIGDINNFKKIIEGRDICIISPRTEDLKKNEISKILNNNISYLHVPMGMNLKNRDDIFKKMDDIQEKIVIYGCSITGKDFGAYLKNKGKIALDFGATLDAWAGLETRSWFKKDGLQNHCLITNNNKLLGKQSR
jgi:hypothetical protein